MVKHRRTIVAVILLLLLLSANLNPFFAVTNSDYLHQNDYVLRYDEYIEGTRLDNYIRDKRHLIVPSEVALTFGKISKSSIKTNGIIENYGTIIISESGVFYNLVIINHGSIKCDGYVDLDKGAKIYNMGKIINQKNFKAVATNAGILSPLSYRYKPIQIDLKTMTVKNTKSPFSVLKIQNDVLTNIAIKSIDCSDGILEITDSKFNVPQNTLTGEFVVNAGPTTKKSNLSFLLTPKEGLKQGRYISNLKISYNAGQKTQFDQISVEVQIGNVNTVQKSIAKPKDFVMLNFVLGLLCLIFLIYIITAYIKKILRVSRTIFSDEKIFDIKRIIICLLLISNLVFVLLHLNISNNFVIMDKNSLYIVGVFVVTLFIQFISRKDKEKSK